jgi:acyl carrier protein
MSIKLRIISEFENVAKEQRKTLAPLTDDLILMESGLDSLGFAIIVTRLEDHLGFDPFATSENVNPPVTFGEFVKLYEHGAR